LEAIMASKTVSTVSSLDAITAELAAAFDNRATILVSCRLAYEGMATPELKDLSDAKKRDALSEATQRALQTRLAVSDDDYEARTKVPANRPGGIGVSASAIKQRVNAYAHVLAAGLTPDILNVTAAFRLHSITGKGHAEFVESITEAVENGTGDFIDLADEASDTLTANRPKKKTDDTEGPAKGEPSPADALAALDWIITNVAAFTGDDRAALEDRVALLTSALV
jgi:hypothetical protein